MLEEIEAFKRESDRGEIVLSGAEDGQQVEVAWLPAPVDSIFIGGGTPSAINPIYINEILCKLKESFPVEEDAEITMECNPGTVTKEALEIYRKAGVNRLSFGLQSCDDKELRVLGRIHTYEEFLQSFELARKAGFQNVNVDLISSIPDQDWEGFRASLEKVAALRPEHISVYSLIVEDGTPFYQMDLSLPDEETERAIYEKTGELLLSLGYHQYEISNYALNGFECRHNIKYWTRGEYLAFGLGASSFIQGDFPKKDIAVKAERRSRKTGIRYKMTSDLRDYMKGHFRKEETEILDQKDAMAEFMFLGLRMNEGVSKDRFLLEFHEDMESVYGETIRKHMEEGMLEYQGNRLILTEQGRNLANYVFCDFIL